MGTVTINNILHRLNAEGGFDRVVNNPRLQLGSRNRRYLMSELLPEVRVPRNVFREDNIEYRTVIANSGTRYSAVQIKGKARVGSMLVELGESDIGAEFTGDAYDTLLDRINAGTEAATMQAMVEILQFADVNVARSLADLREQQRCDAVVHGQVIRVGDNNYEEVVEYPSPPGHRITIPGGTVNSPAGWYDPAHDPIADIVDRVTFLRSEKGLDVIRIISTQMIKAVLNKHPLVQAYGGSVTVVNGQLLGAGTIGFPNAIDAAMAKNDLPAIETYDLRYNTSTSTERFIPNDTMLLVCATGRDQLIGLGDSEPILRENTLGYTAIGRPVGQPNPGVAFNNEVKRTKPPGLFFEGWQTTLPVITTPEAIAVIRASAPTQN